MSFSEKYKEKIENFVIDLFKVDVIKFGQFVLKSGIVSPVYFDLRIIVSYPSLMVRLSELIVELIKTDLIRPDVVCGVPYTALPFATLVSTAMGIPMVMRRKEQKSYGTGRIIEGLVNSGETCVIIEDVITTGSSILETATDVKNAGLKVQEAVVVLDREHGAVDNLKKSGVKVHVLVSMSQLLDTLSSRGHITREIVNNVKEFLSDQEKMRTNQMPNSLVRCEKPNPRLTMSLPQRHAIAKNPLAKKLLRLMQDKESLLCVAADVLTAESLISVAMQVGPHAVVLKTHVDAISNFTDVSAKQLLSLAQQHQFIIMEDRKFADIGNTVRLQYTKVSKWAELVTAHSLPGASLLDGLRPVMTDHEDARGLFLLAEFSCDGALTGPDYAKKTIKMAEDAADIVVGVVCQSADLLTDPGMLQLTPGVRFSRNTDGLGQQYVDCASVVLNKGADLAVVGRGILEAPSVSVAAEEYKTALWEAYKQRVGILA